MSRNTAASKRANNPIASTAYVVPVASFPVPVEAIGAIMRLRVEVAVVRLTVVKVAVVKLVCVTGE